MSFTKLVFDLDEKIKQCNFKKEKHITYRSLSSLLNNYAILCSLPLSTKCELSCRIELSNNTKFDFGEYRVISYEEEGAFKYAINEVKSPTLFSVFGDKTTTAFNMLVKSSVAGATIRIIPLDGLNVGFVEFKEMSKFDFLESSFTEKINTKTENNIINTETIYKNKITVDGGTSALDFGIKRTNNSIFNKFIAYVSNVGEIMLTRNKNDSEVVGNYDTAVGLGEDKVKVYLPNRGQLIPDRADTNDIGSNENKWKKVYVNEGVVLTRLTLPDNPVNGQTFFYAPNKKLVTYYTGKWYSNGEEVIL